VPGCGGGLGRGRRRRLGPAGRPRPVGLAGLAEAEAQWGERNGRLERKRNGPRLGSRAESEEEGFLN
jgi:hypothetical protein